MVNESGGFLAQERDGNQRAKLDLVRRYLAKQLHLKNPEQCVAAKMLCSEHLAFSELSLKAQQGSEGLWPLFSKGLASG